MEFAAAPEYQVFPTRERPLKPYEAAVRAARGDAAGGRATFAPDVAVSDILTPAPALAAELEGVPVATLVPHVLSRTCAPGFPPYSIGARLPRTRGRARALWRVDRPAGRARARAGARGVQRVRGRGSASAPLPWRHTGHLALADAGRRRCRSSSTRARGRRGCASSGR